MSNKKTPNAWDDDDWETQADRTAQEEVVKPSTEGPKTKAERLAEHREAQRKIWEAAEEPAPLPYHVAAGPSIPFAQGFKPKMQLLSRKPVVKTKDPVTGLERLTIDDDDDEHDQRPQQPSAAELAEQRKQKEREYEARRAKLFATPPVETTSGASTPGVTTPPLVGESSRGNYRGRGRGRGARGGRGGQRNESTRTDIISDGGLERRQGSNNRNGESPHRELFDPSAGSKPGSRQQQQRWATSSPTSRGPEQPIRNPIGPDSSGGFGFTNFGAKKS